MGTRFEEAGQDVTEIIASVVSAYHPQLRDAGVTIEAVMAFAATNEEGVAVSPAVSVGGYPCAAKIKVMPLADRTLGSADARITIDGDAWELLDAEEKSALCDHEAEHLELVEKVIDGVNTIIRDDLDRPKLKLRKHDHQHGWFDSVVRRHGAASPEVRQWTEFEARRIQLWLPYIKE